MIEFIRYSPDKKTLWNEFVESSKNGTFLFNRDYMDYHSDRFQDNSFLIYRKGKLYCLLPANIKEDTLYSHQGLTYGGVIMSTKCTAENILEIFNELIDKLKSQGIKKFIYKPIPHIYHSIPSEEDLYALFRNNAKLLSRNVSCTIDLTKQTELFKDRKEAIRRAERSGLKVSLSKDLDIFWNILEENLKNKYDAKPVHSYGEMKRLSTIFPDNIKLWIATLESSVLGGVLCYYTKTSVHTQYISATPEGKKSGAIDLIISQLTKQSRQNNSLEWLDLGTSNEDGGRYLNESLIHQKEGFGGRAICYDTYEIEL